jgi:hypothetical protein
MTQPAAEPTNATVGEGPAVPQPKPESPALPKRWEPFIWSYPKKAALEFRSEKDLDALIDRFWSDPELYNMPRVHVGQDTVIVPAEVVDYLRLKGHPFTVRNVVSMADLPPDEANRIRRGEAPPRQPGGTP